jgi:hypothetical protein
MNPSFKIIIKDCNSIRELKKSITRTKTEDIQDVPTPKKLRTYLKRVRSPSSSAFHCLPMPTDLPQSSDSCPSTLLVCRVCSDSAIATTLQSQVFTAGPRYAAWGIPHSPYFSPTPPGGPHQLAYSFFSSFEGSPSPTIQGCCVSQNPCPRSPPSMPCRILIITHSEVSATFNVYTCLSEL